MTDKENLNTLIGQLSDLMNEKNKEAVDDARKEFSEKLKGITVELSQDYNRLAKTENDSYLLGYRRAMRIIYEHVDELSVENLNSNKNKKSVTETNDYEPRVLNNEIIATLQYIGEHECTVIKDGRPFITCADVWRSFEYNVKVAEPFKFFGNKQRYFGRIVNDFDILD